MAVIGVLVETKVGDHHELVADRRPKLAQRDLDDAVGVPRTRARRVLRRRHTEDHYRRHPQAREPLRLGEERRNRVLEMTGHGHDRERFFDSFSHEERGDEVVDTERRLGDEPSYRRCRGAAGASAVPENWAESCSRSPAYARAKSVRSWGQARRQGCAASRLCGVTAVRRQGFGEVKVVEGQAESRPRRAATVAATSP